MQPASGGERKKFRPWIETFGIWKAHTWPAGDERSQNNYIFMRKFGQWWYLLNDHPRWLISVIVQIQAQVFVIRDIKCKLS